MFSFKQFSVTAEDLSFPFRASTALVTVNIIRNSAQPQFTNVGNYDVTITEDKPVLEEVLTVSATDSDDGINGDVFYTIVDSPAAASVFQIGSESGIISARISLIGTTEDVYRVGSLTVMSLQSNHLSQTSVFIKDS